MGVLDGDVEGGVGEKSGRGLKKKSENLQTIWKCGLWGLVTGDTDWGGGAG